MSWVNVSNSSVTALSRKGVLLFAGSQCVGAPSGTGHCCAGHGHRAVCVCVVKSLCHRELFI